MPNSHERSEDAVAPHQGRPCLQWGLVAVETLLFFASLAFIVTLNVWVLAVWLFLGTLYVLGGLAAVWSGEKLQLEDLTGDKGDGTKQLRSMSSWFVVPPMLAAAMGAVTAIAALLCDTPGTGAPKEPALVIAPALGVILSWVLLHVGFAQMYLVQHFTREEEELRFPEGTTISVLSFLSFSFGLGTSFATGDVELVGIRARRLTLVHAVVGFFYNALVLAVAFQVLQSAVSG